MLKDPWKQVREDFPILNAQVNGKPLIYLDNGATTQVPEPVLQALLEQYHCHQANVHRGIHALSERSTGRMEDARRKVARFLGAACPEEVIFTSGTTGSINLVARSLSFRGLGPGDTVITTEMEHHANLIPWQEACRRTGAALRVVPVTAEGELDLETLDRFLKESPRLVAVTWVSNVTGTVNPVEQIIPLAHEKGAMVLVDGAQAVRHMPLDMQKLDCDFFCFSGHKMMAPTGTGVLYGKKALLEELIPENFGGGMVDQVTALSATYGQLPFRLEAGTPNIAGNIALGAAVDYLEHLGPDNISKREEELLSAVEETLAQLPAVRILGKPRRRAGCVSFNLADCHYYDVAKLLDLLGIAVRSGHHCAQPLLTALGETGAVRISPAFYNTVDEAAQMGAALKKVDLVLRGGR